MQIRNLAIIAHVDHGKTTLIDGLLKQTKTFRDNQAEMSQTAIMDSNDLEREKGITILAKNTAVFYKDYKINIIDTPGHSDFGGEVERVIGMADGALLVVDAAEGPLPQTRFVLEQAFKKGLKVILLINKIDRKDADVERVLAKTEELFLSLAETEAQLDFPVLFGAGREGKVWRNLPESVEDPGNLEPLFEEIIKSVPAPTADPNQPFKMQVANLDFDSYKGSYAIGKVVAGTVKKNQSLALLEENTVVGQVRANQIFTSKGLDRVEVDQAQAGDIIAITGIEKIKIGQTLADPSDPTGFPMIKIAEPTLKIQINPNTSPFSGREGDFCTARQLEERLMAEKKTNLGLRIEQNPSGTGFLVAGRGELHLAVLIENMRREGYEMEVSRPQVIYKDIEGVMSEPVEELTVEIVQDYVGVITEELGKRQAQLQDSFTNDKGVARMVYHISSKNLLGFRTEILTKTRGNGIFASQFLGYFPVGKPALRLRNGVLIASENGESTSYALYNMQQRGTAFIGPGVRVYEGMIVGLANQNVDLEINVCKAKQLTNFRSNADAALVLAPPKILSLEQSLDFLEEDELLEVTPQNLRLRKKLLSKSARAKAKKN